MAGLSQTAWVEDTVNGHYRAKCTVTADATISDAYTYKTPAGLDPSKPFILTLTCSAAPDAANAAPIALWVGWTDAFAITGNAATTLPLVAGTGANYMTILDDCVAAVSPLVFMWEIDTSRGHGQSVVANAVTAGAPYGFRVKAPAAPYYVFNIDGDTLEVHTATWGIIQ